MTRPTLSLTLMLAVVTLCQSVGLARSPWDAVRGNVERAVRSNNPVRNWVEPSRGNNNKKKGSNNNRNSNNGNQNARKLPKTMQLDNDLRNTYSRLSSLASRISSIERSIETARKRAQDIDSMVRTLGRVDDKVNRIKRELESLTKIPQLRLLRPLVTNLGKVRNQIHSVRVKADKANREVVKPLISKLRSVEKKVEAKVKEIRNVASQTNQARQKLTQLTSYVSSRGYKRGEVRSLENIARPVSSGVRSVNQMISEMDRSLSGLDRDFNTLASHLSAVSRAKSAVTKLDRDLAKADKAARDLSKVMSKRISVKFPVKFSVSIRELLEAPGKVLDVVLKPLQKLADKALQPVLKKLKLEIKVPGQIGSIPNQMNGLQSKLNGLGKSISKVENALKKQVPQKFTSEINKLKNKSTSQL